ASSKNPRRQRVRSEVTMPMFRTTGGSCVTPPATAGRRGARERPGGFAGKTDIRRFLVQALAAVALGIAGCAGGIAAAHARPRTGETMDQKAQIQSTVDAMTSAFNKGDIAGVMRTYEP